MLNPACQHLDKINFNNPEHLLRVLYLDKHTRIEGLCSEIAFMEDVVRGNLTPVATDFWFSRTRNSDSYHVRKVLASPSIPLTDFDYMILDEFADFCPGLVSIVWFDEVMKGFREIGYDSGKRFPDFNGLGLAMDPVIPPEIAEEKDRSKIRIKKAVDFMESRNLLRDITIKRMFANCWLGGSVWDVDVFTLNDDGHLVALEIKQKFPTGAGTFGMNEGQQRFYGFLARYGIEFFHIILEKPVRDKNIPAIDLLTLPRYTHKTNWKFARLSSDDLSQLRRALSDAPEETSIFGHTKMPYRHVEDEHFKVLKGFRRPDPDIRKKLFGR